MNHLTMLTGNVDSLISFISCSCTTVSNTLVKSYHDGSFGGFFSLNPSATAVLMLSRADVVEWRTSSGYSMLATSIFPEFWLLSGKVKLACKSCFLYLT